AQRPGLTLGLQLGSCWRMEISDRQHRKDAKDDHVAGKTGVGGESVDHPTVSTWSCLCMKLRTAPRADATCAAALTSSLFIFGWPRETISQNWSRRAARW